MGNIRVVISARRTIEEILFLFQKIRVIGENARLPSTKALPADRRFYEGYGDRTEKGVLDLTSNRIRYPHGCEHGASAVANMVLTRKCGKIEGCRCSRSDVSTRGSTHPPISCGGPAGHLYLDCAACARYPGCSRVDQDHFPSIRCTWPDSRRPLRILPLSPQHRRQRLEWCWTRATWMTEWRNVVFSDESHFFLSSDSGCIRVWRRRGDRSNPVVTVERPTA